ncbi:MAG: cytochrome b [Proteobacteria bacterium]|nr:cytochrome b [Pseudomonadota bacterium]
MAAAQYGTTAKWLHWLMVAVLIAQYSIGWLMPDIHGTMTPGSPMIWHLSIGVLVLALAIVRLSWRVTHPVAPDPSLPPYQRIASGVVHWLLYVLVLLTCLSGWLFASARGWKVLWLFWLPLPMLTPKNPVLLKQIDGIHQVCEWALLATIAAHVVAAVVHQLHFRDGIMRRMLPRSSAAR